MKQVITITTVFFQLYSLSLLGQQPRLIPPVGNIKMVRKSLISPDKKTILTSSSDNTIKLWDLQSGALLFDKFVNSNSPYNEAFFSSDGQNIICFNGGSFSLWDAKNGIQLKTFPGTSSFEFGLPNDEFANLTISSRDNLLITIDDSVAKVWDIATGKIILTLNENRDLYCAFFSPDGKKILTAARDSITGFLGIKEKFPLETSVKIWDVKTGLLIAELKGNNSAISDIKFSPDGKKLLTTYNRNSPARKTVKIWNLITGELLSEINEEQAINYSAFSPDSKWVITHSRNSKIWNAETGVLSNYFNDSTSSSTKKISFSADGKKILGCFSDNSISILDTETGTLNSYQVNSDNVIFSPDGRRFISFGIYDRSAQVWDVEKKKIVANLKNVTSSGSNPGTFSSDGLFFISYDYENVKIWNITTGRLISELKGHVVKTDFVYFDSTGNIKINYDNKYEKTWDLYRGKIINSFQKNQINSYRYNASFFSIPILSPDLTLVANLVSHDTIQIRNNFTKKHISYLIRSSFSVESTPDPPQLLSSVKYYSLDCFSDDGTKMFTTSKDSCIQIWDTKSGSLLADIKMCCLPTTASFSRTGKKIAIGYSADSIRIFDIENKKLLDPFRGWSRVKWTEHLTFSPDENKIATNTSKGEVKIFDVNSGTLLGNFKVDTSYFTTIIFSQSGNKIITLSNMAYVYNNASDRHSIIFDLEQGEILADLEGHNSIIASADFSPNEKYLVTSSLDNSKKVWDAQSGKLLYSFFAVDSTDYLVIDSLDRYDGTEAARNLLHFTCGTEVIELSQVKDQLWVPNLVERIMRGEIINAKSLTDLDICSLTPEVEDLSSLYEYHFRIYPRKGGLGTCVVYINGIELKRINGRELNKVNKYYELKIPFRELSQYFVADHENIITVKAFTADNSFSSRGLKIYEDKAAVISNRPNLFAVMIGISDYKGEELDLKYAAKDANDLSTTLSISAKKFLNTDGKEHVFTYNLTTDTNRYLYPEKNGIKKVLEEIGKMATPNDILLLFFAGHGIIDDKLNKFFFLTADASFRSSKDLSTNVGITTDELAEWMKPGKIKVQKRILIFDACKSGQAIKDFVKIGNVDQEYISARSDEKAKEIKAIEKLNEKSGLFIFSASASNQNAYETSQFSQGILTYALLKTIKEQPDILQSGKYLDISRWFNSAEKIVTEISKESGARQNPQIVSNTNFNIGIVDDEVVASIKISAGIILFTSSNFQNKDDNIADDDLGLNKLINEKLSDISTGEIIYAPMTNASSIFSLSGRYEVIGDTVSVKINLKNDNKIENKFEVMGKKPELDALASEIISKTLDWLKNNK